MAGAPVAGSRTRVAEGCGRWLGGAIGRRVASRRSRWSRSQAAMWLSFQLTSPRPCATMEQLRFRFYPGRPLRALSYESSSCIGPCNTLHAPRPM